MNRCAIERLAPSNSAEEELKIQAQCFQERNHDADIGSVPAA